MKRAAAIAIGAAAALAVPLVLGAGVAFAKSQSAKRRQVLKLSQWPLQMAAASVYDRNDNPGPLSLPQLDVSFDPPGEKGFQGYFGPWLALQYAHDGRVFAKEVGVLRYRLIALVAAALKPGDVDRFVPADFFELVM